MYCLFNSVRSIHLTVGSSGLFILYIKLIVELLGHKNAYFQLIKTLPKICQNGRVIYISTSMYENSSCSTFSTIFGIYSP